MSAGADGVRDRQLIELARSIERRMLRRRRAQKKLDELSEAIRVEQNLLRSLLAADGVRDQVGSGAPAPGGPDALA